MNFDLTEEQQMIVESIAKFVATDSPVSRFRELRNTERGWDPAIWKMMGEVGWLSVAYPEEQGGFGGRMVDLALILEQFGRGLVPEPFIPSVVVAGGLISRIGSEEQVERYLTPMTIGKTSLAFAQQEVQSRYNTTDCLTLATRDGGDYLINGEKTWVLNGASADQIVVVARSAGEQMDPAGLSFFIVEGDASGLERIVVPGMDGQRAGVLRFDNVRVSPDALLGEEGAAGEWVDWAVDRGTAAAVAEGLGALEELFDRTVAYIKEREQFGSKIGSFQALQHRAADMFAEIELCKASMILAAIQADSEDIEERKAAVSTAKVQLQDGGWFIQENAIQLHGGIGVTDEQDEGLFFKRVRVLQGLFGDADYHVGRYQSLQRFEEIL